MEFDEISETDFPSKEEYTRVKQILAVSGKVKKLLTRRIPSSARRLTNVDQHVLVSYIK